MTRFAERVQVAVAASAVAVALAVGLNGGSGGTPVAAQDKDTPFAKKVPDPGCEYLGKGPSVKTAGDLSTGIAACELCHKPGGGGAKKFVDNYKSDEFVLLNESATWLEKDVHSQALETLKKPLGQQMQKLLGVSDGKPIPGYDVTKDVRCLTCHSADKSPLKRLEDKTFADFATNSGGVNCTVCHGMHEKWQSLHFKEPDQPGPIPWREMSPAYKWEMGMADLRNPVVKAMLCVSCHVGNPAEGKVVTHEMYAAGHPPLPPFELSSYMQAEPKHWGYPVESKSPAEPKLTYFHGLTDDKQMADKGADGRQQFWTPAARWKIFHFHPGKDESYLSRHLAVGVVAALRAEAQLIRADAERAAQPDADGMDFARFDCGACHHALENPSARQERGYGGFTPGRLTLRSATDVPAGIVAAHAAQIKAGGLAEKAQGFDGKWLAFRKAVAKKALGDPAGMRAAADDLITWCDGFLKVQSETADPLYTKEHADSLRKMIEQAVTDKAKVTDPDAAMTLAWAHQTLAREAGVVFPPAALKNLGEHIPLNVREEPYEATHAQFKRRMEKAAGFRVEPFLGAIRGLNGGK
ncbi:MAG: hypothetical protein C0501_23325 [Isosphaera sp.]|nr:hypothetical protein [Isosphaera sp.]